CEEVNPKEKDQGVIRQGNDGIGQKESEAGAQQDGDQLPHGGRLGRRLRWQRRRAGSQWRRSAVHRRPRCWQPRGQAASRERFIGRRKLWVWWHDLISRGLHCSTGFWGELD